jgi:hypothetical protein
MFLCQLQSLHTVRRDRDHFHIVNGGKHQARVAAGFLNVISDEHSQFSFLGDLRLRHIQITFFQTA